MLDQIHFAYAPKLHTPKFPSSLVLLTYWLPSVAAHIPILSLFVTLPLREKAHLLCFVSWTPARVPR